MQQMTASQQAAALYRAHGPAADALVAERIRSCEERGRAEEAADWRLIQRTIRELRGTREH